MVLFGGACVVALGVCVVTWGGTCVVLFRGGMRGFIQGGAMRGFFSFFGYNEIRSMSGRYASYWNAFLFNMKTLTYSQSAVSKLCVKVKLHSCSKKLMEDG